MSNGKERRTDPRVFVGLLVRLRALDVEQFIDSYATNISSGGVFIQSKKLYPKGTSVRFEIQLKTGKTVLKGEGVVAWTRQRALPGGKVQVPGMGVKFLRLDPDSAKLVKQIVAIKSNKVSKKNNVRTAPAPKPNVESIPLEVQAPATAYEPSIQVSGEMADPEATPEVQIPMGMDLDLAHKRQDSPTAAPATGGLVSTVIGIDLGTTNSCASVVKDGKPRIIPSKKGYRTIPSIVAYDDSGRLLVGHRAKAQMEMNPENTVYGSKRLLGRQFHSPAVRQIMDRFHYKIIEGPKHEAAVSIVGRPFSLQQVAAFILTEIRDVGRDLLGEEINRAVITVPAYYNEKQRQAVREAGMLAGLIVERIVNEPTAAALAFGYNRNLDQRVLVYDLGGGTFDASVMELTENVYEVIATGGDPFLGGVDFDNQVVDYLLQEFVQSIGKVPTMDRSAMQRIRDAAEAAKCALSEKDETIVRLPFFATVDNTPKDLEVRLSRTTLEQLVSPLVERSMKVAARVLAKAGFGPADIDSIILVGGQSRMPLVWRRIQDVFGKQPHKGVHPDEAVAMGAALLADSVGKIDSVVLIDVLPQSIGLGLPGGRYLPVLQAGTSLPTTKVYQISTFRNMQRVMELLIFQGDHERVLGNDYLSTLVVSGIPPGPKGSIMVELTFSLDQESLLKVSARDLTNSQTIDARLMAAETEQTIRQKLRIPPGEVTPGTGDKNNPDLASDGLGDISDETEQIDRGPLAENNIHSVDRDGKKAGILDRILGKKDHGKH